LAYDDNLLILADFSEIFYQWSDCYTHWGHFLIIICSWKRIIHY